LVAKLSLTALNEHRQSFPNNFGFLAANPSTRRAFFRLECATLPFCDRHVSVPRKDVQPVWTRSFPIGKEPTTLGQHLKKKRVGADIRQSKAAQLLEISTRSLSLWECDRLFPTTPYHARIIKYLDYDPFKMLAKLARVFSKDIYFAIFTFNLAPSLHISWA